MKSKKHFIWFGGIVLLIITFYLGYCELMYHYGVHIDGIATVEVLTPRGSQQVTTGLDTPRLLGRHIKSSSLVRLVKTRVRHMQGKPEVSFDHKRTRREYKVMLAASLLSKIREPDGFLVVLALSNDPYFVMRGSAVAALRIYGDRRALPTLLRLLRDRKPCNGFLVTTIAELGDDSAVPILIDTIPAGGTRDSEARLKAIEEITGLSLQEMREEWGLLYYGDKLDRFHKAMHKWWEENKAQSRNGGITEHVHAGDVLKASNKE